MIGTRCQQLVLQWHALRAALATMRDEEDGMATLEVIIIAAGLIVVAGVLIGYITTGVTRRAASIT